MVDKELIAIISCPECPEQKGSIYGVLLNSGVRQNVTEPTNLQNVKVCPECGSELIFTRSG